MEIKEEKKAVKFVTYKKLNVDASIYGFPFTVFFIVLGWIIISFFLILSGPFLIKILMSVIGVGGLFAIYIIYNRFGIKKVLKIYDLYFKNVSIIKMNEPLKLEKIKLKKDE